MEGRPKISRKKFVFPMPERRVEKEVWVRTSWFNSNEELRTVVQWEKVTSDEFLRKVQDFIENIGPDRLVGVSESLSSQEFTGDEGKKNIVVWYWEAA